MERTATKSIERPRRLETACVFVSYDAKKKSILPEQLKSQEGQGQSRACQKGERRATSSKRMQQSTSLRDTCCTSEGASIA